MRLVFQDAAEFSTSLKRPASLLAHDQDLGVDFATLLADELNGKQWSPSVTGALLEKFIEAIEPSQFVPHVQTALVSLLRMTLDLYVAEDYPLRRLRTIARFMSVISSTGQASETFDSLKAEADTLAATTQLAKDVVLANYRHEYHGRTLILCALQTYHLSGSSADVATVGRVALDASRSFICPTPSSTPPSTSASKRVVSGRGKTATTATKTAKAPVRTAARKVTPTSTKAKSTASPPKSDAPAIPLNLDDAERISDLLHALASLFGLLGNFVPKIEALNLLRALQSNSVGMTDAFIQTSAQVAVEYARLGKYSRASQVFSKAIKRANDPSADVSPAARVDLHLRHCRFLALSGQINQARQDFLAAKKLSSEIPAPSATGTYAARWVQICAVSERVALAHAAVAAIKTAEADVTSAIANLVIAYRLWSRAASGIAHIAADVPEDDLPPEATAEEKESTPTPASKDKKKSFAFDGKRLGGLQWYFAEVSLVVQQRTDSTGTVFSHIRHRVSTRPARICQGMRVLPPPGSRHGGLRAVLDSRRPNRVLHSRVRDAPFALRQVCRGT